MKQTLKYICKQNWNQLTVPLPVICKMPLFWKEFQMLVQRLFLLRRKNTHPFKLFSIGYLTTIILQDKRSSSNWVEAKVGSYFVNSSTLNCMEMLIVYQGTVGWKLIPQSGWWKETNTTKTASVEIVIVWKLQNWIKPHNILKEVMQGLITWNVMYQKSLLISDKAFSSWHSANQLLGRNFPLTSYCIQITVFARLQLHGIFKKAHKKKRKSP